MRRFSHCSGIIFLFFVLSLPVCCAADQTNADLLQEPETQTAPKESAAQLLFQEALALRKSRHWLDAAHLLQQLLAEYPDFSQYARAEKTLGDLNIQIIRSDIPIPQTTLHTIQPDETIGVIAKRFGTTEALIKISNNLAGSTIVPGKKLRVWTQPFAITIDKTKNTLSLSTNGEIVKIYRVATGADNITPRGEFTITSKLKNPTWFKKGEIIPPEDPRNALGTRWLGLNESQYGIHGTVQPDLIGQQVTHGCVRMLNADVEELYDLVPIGTNVWIIE